MSSFAVSAIVIICVLCVLSKLVPGGSKVPHRGPDGIPRGVLYSHPLPTEIGSIDAIWAQKNRQLSGAVYRCVLGVSTLLAADYGPTGDGWQGIKDRLL